MRRRHGIPDNDHRPFNVAYAAVQRSRQDKERPASAQRSQENVITQTAHEARSAQAEQVVRNRREGHSTPQPQTASSSKFPGQYTSSTTEQMYPSLPASEAVPPTPPPPPASTPANRVVFADGYNTSALHIGLPTFAERPARKTNGILKPANARRKRGLEEEPIIVDNSKKSRVEGDEFIDGDEDAGWQNSPSGLTRGNKRSFGDEDDNEEAMLSKRAREKRPRQVSRDHEAVASDEDMEVDEDEVVEVRTTPRGRKRDRVEAGPSFEGEEDEEPAEVEPKSRGRKRRNKRRSDVGVKARGTKRERDLDDVEMLDEAEESFAEVSRKKRGKQAQVVQEDGDEDDRYADISIDVSPDRVKGKEIGEEWESNGVRYKVGLNGQRLRQALVKKAGQRYIMPKDSQHPDREANIEVCVEKWLTEEEFREAKQQRLLAWQDSTPSKSSEPSTPSSEVPPSPSSGKHLLWDSTGSPKPNSPKDPFSKPSLQPSQSAIRQSVATTIGLQPTFRRRIAGNFTPTSPSPTPPSPGQGLADSTNGSPRRAQKGYSKWEKQDLEAKAMMKMREANQKKREEKEALDRLEKEKKEKLRASLMPQPTIPVISVTKPAEENTAPKNMFTSGGAASGSPAKPAFSLASAAPLDSAPQPSLSSAPPLGSTSAPSAPPLGSTPAANSTPLGGASKPATTNDPFFKQAPAPSTNKAAFSFPPATSSPLATNSPTKAPEKPKVSGLGFPSAINPTPAPASVSTPATSSTPAQPAPKFSFSQNVSTPSSAPTNSLLARMGPPQQQQQQQSTPAPASQPAQKPQTTFLFNTPPATQSGTPSSSFFNKPAESTSTPAPAAAPAPAKFNFSATSPTKPNATSSTLSGALGSASHQAGSSKPAESSSNFGTFSFAKPSTTGSGSGVSNPNPSSGGALGSAPQAGGSKPVEPSSNFGTFSFAKPPTIGSSGVSNPNPFGAATTGKFNFGTKESTPTPAPTPGFGAQGQGTPKESTPAPSTGPADNPASSGSADKSPFGAPKESTAAPASTSTPAFGGFGAPGNSPFGASKESTPAPTAPSSTPAAPTFSFAPSGKSAFGTPKESTPASTKPAASPFGSFSQSTTFGTPKESTPASSTPATSAFGGFGGADKPKPFGGFGQDSSKPVFGAGQSSAFGKSGIFGAAAKEKETSGSDSSANGTTSAPTFGSSAFASPFSKAAQSGGPGTPSSAFGTGGAFGTAAAKGTETSGPESSSAGPTFASTSSSPSPFGKPPQSGAPSSTFGTGGAFGATTTKGTEASGPDSSSAQTTTATFGSTSSPSPFGKPTSDAPKPVFSFATPGTTPAPSSGAFSFASKPNAFGGGSGSTTPSVFGAASEKK
ncbi:hypothetical protein ARMGADRAFT_277502 [Armillaria gallica]|uniref:Uncharacterized protein n=1 Tax=Armillaria gallica TaxID=47427 RepID=A0A2H3EQN1_ARMGA|nr:hypothetical protein ARMGADRAFT_277502 [Armillaria gallica]